MNRKRPFPMFNGVCRSCGRSWPANRREFFRAGGMRCQACGGVCDPDKPLFKKHTGRGKVVRGWHPGIGPKPKQS